MQIELQFFKHRATNPTSFVVEFLDYALHHLIADAHEGHRIYELMSIRRPGDVWQYIWIRLVDVPDNVMDTYTYKRKEPFPKGTPPWPERMLPLNIFDSFFYWAREDTSEESECWLTERGSGRFQNRAQELFAKVLETQEFLRASTDLLICKELSNIAAHQHDEDMAAHSLYSLTTEEYQSPVVRKWSDEFYTKLAELLALPEVVCVAVRGDEDYHTLRLVCSEQLRRAQATGNPQGHDMPLSVLGDSWDWFNRWDAVLTLHSEGLGYGDLLVENDPPRIRPASTEPASARPPPTPRQKEYSAFVFRMWQQMSRYWLLPGEVDALPGQEIVTGPGWTLRLNALADFDYTAESGRMQKDFIKRLERKK